MPRLHLFEIEDQPWCPAVLRDGATAYLELMVRQTGIARGLAPVLRKVLERSGQRHVVDLCSGGGGPLPIILEHLDVTATLTDLYPNREAFEEASRRTGGRIGYRLEPVDCGDLPEDLSGLLTLFNAFHHFRPAQARALLQQACRRGQPIAVFEVVSRPYLPGVFFLPLLVLLTMPLVRPRHLRWWFFTYLVPLIPLLVMWDGLVSCLRAYDREELEELTRDLNDFSWEIGSFDLPVGRGTSLVGIPRGLSNTE